MGSRGAAWLQDCLHWEGTRPTVLRGGVLLLLPAPALLKHACLTEESGWLTGPVSASLSNSDPFHLQSRTMHCPHIVESGFKRVSKPPPLFSPALHHGPLGALHGPAPGGRCSPGPEGCQPMLTGSRVGRVSIWCLVQRGPVSIGSLQRIQSFQKAQTKSFSILARSRSK